MGRPGPVGLSGALDLEGKVAVMIACINGATIPGGGMLLRGTGYPGDCTSVLFLRHLL